MDLTEWLELLRPAWMNAGSCVGMDQALFFPQPFNVGRRGYQGNDPTAPARRVCAGCTIREQCLEYALANNIDHGVWGGESERSRRRIRRQRTLAA